MTMVMMTMLTMTMAVIMMSIIVYVFIIEIPGMDARESAAGSDVSGGSVGSHNRVRRQTLPSFA